ncbi:MAG: protein kinase [Acidobacteria bacterium]|nr:protein kinase [Acidobacteriota bacterium]
MTPERWRQIDELFRTVANRPPAEREAHLTRVCGDDVDLRREVLDLLAHEPPESFLHNPIKQAALAVTHEPDDELLGRRIGPYRLTRMVGRGGMGAVYEAVRDDDQFQQQVALKLIKRGMDTAFVRDRFLRERQILASLDHPHIARLFDGGATTEGLPYFVMEFVDGEPITDYCQRRRLSLNQKLLLFRDVCSAVQHAHQKLVIHRDLKPSNILVTADGTPKLLDFGIAKLLSPDPGEAITRTETAVRLMTPDYASPEQVRGGAISTTTDVYSLGVVLYELLAERRPYEFETYSPLVIERAICDTEAPRPSDAARQQTDASAKLARQLAGDLDNIILMALRKEPERRYQSVEKFSEDLRRYLNGLPVTARPDTFTYRTGKFVRRHRVAVVAAALVLLSLLGGILATTLAARRARAERERAERRFAQVRKLSNTFLFEFHDTIAKVPGTTEARAMVAKTALEYLNSLAQEATGDAQLEWELAVAYQKVGDVQGDPWAANLGHSREAMESYQKSLRLAQELNRAGSNDLKVARLLAQDYFKLGMLQAQAGEMAAAHETLRQALASAQTLEQQTHELEDIALLENCHIRLGDTFLDSGDPVNALESYRHEIRLAERRTKEFPGDVAKMTLAMSHSRVAEPLISLGDLPGSLAGYRKSVELIDELLPNHATDPKYLRVRMIGLIWLGNLSGNPRFINLGETQAALQYYRESLAIAEKLVAADPKDAFARRDLAGGHRLMGEILTLDQPAQAVEQFRQALGIVREMLAVTPDGTQLRRREAQYLKGQADAFRRLGDRQSALQNLLKAQKTWQDLLAHDATDLRIRAELHGALLALADVSLESGDQDGALAHYREALSLAETPPVEQSADLYVRWRLADSYAGLSRYHAVRAASAPIGKRLDHWREARQYAEQSLNLWEGWSQHATSTNFDRRHREQAAQVLAICDAALAKLNASPTRK